MKTISIKTLATGIVASTLLFAASCKKGDTGATGASGINGTVAASTDGYIKGQLTGTRQDGTPISESFDFENYYGTPSGTLDSSGIVNPYTFKIARSTDIFGNNVAGLSITSSSSSSLTTTNSNITLNNFKFTKSLGTNKEFLFTLTNTGTAPTGTITTISYTPSSGMFNGTYQFNLTATQNSTGKVAYVSGSFQATITQLFMMTHRTGNEVKANTSSN